MRTGVVERFTLLDRNTIQYRAVIEDANVFTRPWTMQFLLQREIGQGYQIFESACHGTTGISAHIRKAAYDKGIK